jgi:ubiquinone/menaquinone biosynthesis C-methylase UbiE
VGDETEWSKLKSTIYSFLYRNPKSNRLVVDYAMLTPDDRVLDIGCGPGSAVRAAARFVTGGHAAGVDRSAAMIDIARRRSTGFDNVGFEVGTAESLPMGNGVFTVAWTAHSFHHWSDGEAGLREIKRVLSPGGRLFVVENRSMGEHGLTLDRAIDLQYLLGDLGFVDASVDRLGKDYVIGARVAGSTSVAR